jgi:dTDP-4-dehydrorhamnose 3,5-epimerase
MIMRALTIDGAWEVIPKQFADARGMFQEWFSLSVFEKAVGERLDLHQANLSVSSAGVVRGIHFADFPPSQAKYVICARGSVLDVVVDIRVGSPTFGQWDSVLLDDESRKAIFISEGLGHAFMALDPDSTVLYLCSAPYAPGHEHGVNPLDPAIGITWPTHGRNGQPLTPTLSDKDAEAPSLAEAQAVGLLPTFESLNTLMETRAAKRNAATTRNATGTDAQVKPHAGDGS